MWRRLRRGARTRGCRRSAAGCPVDCIHPTEDEPGFADVRQLFIDPEECIDCDACVEVCPVDAIFVEDQLPEEWQHFTTINADYYITSRSPRHIALRVGDVAATHAEPEANGVTLF